MKIYSLLSLFGMLSIVSIIYGRRPNLKKPPVKNLTNKKLIPGQAALLQPNKATMQNLPQQPELALKQSEIRICDISPKNQYEAQIFSGWGSTKGSRIERYSYLGDQENPIPLPYVYREFFESTVKDGSANLFKNDFDVKKANNQQQRKHETQVFEADLYIKPLMMDSLGELSPLEKSISSFLSDGTEWVIPINKNAQNDLSVVKPLEWILIEISESPRQLVNKLWQLERALLLRPEFHAMGVSGIVVLLNGDSAVAKEAIEGIQIPSTSNINRYPVYVGWVPTRNIYTKIAHMDLKITNMDLKITNIELKLDILISNQQGKIEV